ncbi:MAG: 50S ribosomal protein L10 [Bacteroidota bacterium]|nr:50S ribosomal protein L10 [Bacteroidota bacterium]
MTRQEKKQVIEDLTTELKEVKNFYLTDIAGLNSSETSALRRLCFKSSVKLSVVKNTLLAKAMEASERDFGDLKDTLKGNTSLMFSEVGNLPAKIIKDFRKKYEKPFLKGAFVEESIYIGDDQISTLVSLKSKEEVIGEIIGLLKSPVKNVISALKSSDGKLSGILKTLSNK